MRGASIVAIVAVLATGTALCADGTEPSNLHLHGDAMRGSVERALAGAARRLAKPACAQLLGDFLDSDGRSLRDNLAATGHTAVEYLDEILFEDGDHAGRCEVPGVLVVARPGSRVVRVCSRFFDYAHRDPTLTEAIIIHEALHTLGLGENPPASVDITARVLKRCH